MEHRDAAANCSSDEDVAAALAEGGGNSEISGDDSDRRVEAWEHGYMVDGFLVRDASEDEVQAAVVGGSGCDRLHGAGLHVQFVLTIKIQFD